MRPGDIAQRLCALLVDDVEVSDPATLVSIAPTIAINDAIDELLAVDTVTSGPILVVSVSQVGVLPVNEYSSNRMSITALSASIKRELLINVEISGIELAEAIHSELSNQLALRLNSITQATVAKVARLAESPSTTLSAAKDVATSCAALHLYIATLQTAGSRINYQQEHVMALLSASATNAVGLNNWLSNILLARTIQTQAEVAAKAHTVAATDARRSELLARFAALLLLPSLWFTFLGANVFPSRLYGIPVDGGAALAASILGALASMALSSVLVSYIFKKER
jgi:hypothetical protein